MTMTNHEEITGRDDYLIAQALHEAIKALSALPDLHRPNSNIEDMRRILLERYRGSAMHMVMQDDIAAALAELPENASNEERAARIRSVTDEWNERYRTSF
jgi:hypothetical protein